MRLLQPQQMMAESRHVVDEAYAGDIIGVFDPGLFSIGDTICTKEEKKALPRIEVDEPTVSMLFSKNISPLAGRDGKMVTSAKIWERLQKEALRNVSIRIEKNMDDTFTVKGRGEFQMAIIVEEMRREGFELCVGRPHIIFKTDSEGRKTEPVEVLLIDCPDNRICKLLPAFALMGIRLMGSYRQYRI